MHAYWKANTAHAEIALLHPDIKKAVEIMVDVWTAEQRHEDDIQAPGQKLYRRPKVKPAPKQPWTGFAGLPRNGKGTRTAHTGMIWSAFRPVTTTTRFYFFGLVCLVNSSYSDGEGGHPIAVVSPYSRGSSIICRLYLC